MSTLSGQTAFVTGGGTGIGRAIAIDLAAAGVKVVVCGRRMEPLEEMVQAVSLSGGVASAVTCDLTDPETIESCALSLLAEHGTIDILINNAGFSHSNKFFTPSSIDTFGSHPSKLDILSISEIYIF